MEQSSEDFDFRVRQPTGKRHAGGLYAGRRGTVPESSQSRVVRLQPVLGSKYTSIHFLKSFFHDIQGRRPLKRYRVETIVLLFAQNAKSAYVCVRFSLYRFPFAETVYDVFVFPS